MYRYSDGVTMVAWDGSFVMYALNTDHVSEVMICLGASCTIVVSIQNLDHQELLVRPSCHRLNRQVGCQQLASTEKSV